jgi:ClpP class serine protease
MFGILNTEFFGLEGNAFSRLVANSLNGVVPVFGNAGAGTETVMRDFSNAMPVKQLGWLGIDIETVKDKKIAINEINGISSRGRYSDTDTERISTQILLADGNDFVAAHVLKISSPGGDVNGIFPLANVIANLKKPIVAHVSYMAASCQALTASQCTEVYLEDAVTSIGSLGIMSVIQSEFDHLEKEGVATLIMTSAGAENKSIFHPARKLDENDPAIAAAIAKKQKALNLMSTQMWAMVQKKRPQIKSDIGVEMFFGKDAIKVGLADRIGSLDAAVARAAYLSTQIK